MMDNYDVVLNQIKEKIKNRNFTFTKLERGIIHIEKSLLMDIMDLLSKDYSNWKNMDKETENDLLDFSYINEQFVFNYYKYEIDNGTINSYFDESGMLSDEQINELVLYLQDRLKDSQYTITGYTNAMILKIIMRSQVYTIQIQN